VTVVDELELELLELLELLVTATLVPAALVGTVNPGAPAVFVEPALPPPQPATASASRTATVPAVAAVRCMR